MRKPPRAWTVSPHGSIDKIDDNLWCVESGVPGVPGLKRRMSIVRRVDGSLLFFNAVPVTEAALGEIRALGAPAHLVIPQHLHMTDAHAFRARLGLRVYAPASTRSVVSAEVEVDGAFEDIPADPAVAVDTIAGFKTGEGFAIVKSDARVSLLVADVVLNLPRASGPLGLLYYVLGFTGDRPQLPIPVRLRVLRDRAALRAQLGRLATLPGLTRIVPSHGAVIDADPGGVLREIAASL